MRAVVNKTYTPGFTTSPDTYTVMLAADNAPVTKPSEPDSTGLVVREF